MPHRREARAEAERPAAALVASEADADAARAALTPTAFAELYESRARVFWCIAAAVLGRRTHVEDVLQDAVMIALRKLDQFDANSNFVAWMGQIVRFVALNHARKLGRARAGSVDAQVIEHLADEGRPESPGAAPVAGNGQVLPEQAGFDDDVLSALNMLEDTARACLLLRTVMELSYRDISLALDIPEGTAMSHVHRARQSMRRMLADDTDEPGAQGRRP